MNFTTEMESRDVLISNFSLEGKQKGADFEVLPGTFKIDWDLEFETREWGIKDITLVVQKVEGFITVEKFREDGYKDEEQIIINTNENGWEIESEVKVSEKIIQNDGDIYPTDVEIDFKDHKIYVS
jgi:hypothetical protein